MDRTSFNQTLDLVQEALGDRYLVTGPLAQGGMSLLLRGRQTLLDQPVAIKVMHAQAVGNRSLRDRFVREARILASLQAPQVSRVYDAGALKDGRLYLVMELLQGENLEAISERGPLALGLAARLLMQVCDGLIAAHDKGIVHRDLKPENVFIVPDASGQMCAKLIDFGIAKDASDQKEVTGTYTIVGSPLYVPPEQIASSRTVDKRADIWAMGIMLYQLVLQRHPFEDASLALLLNKIQNEPLPPFPPDSDPMFELIVERCLAKDPDDRYPTANELKEALASLADQEPIDHDEDMPTIGPRPAPRADTPTASPPPEHKELAAPPRKPSPPAAVAPRPKPRDPREEPVSAPGDDLQPVSSTENTLLRPPPATAPARPPSEAAPVHDAAPDARPPTPNDEPTIDVSSTLPSPGQPSVNRPRPAQSPTPPPAPAQPSKPAPPAPPAPPRALAPTPHAPPPAPAQAATPSAPPQPQSPPSPQGQAPPMPQPAPPHGPPPQGPPPAPQAQLHAAPGGTPQPPQGFSAQGQDPNAAPGGRPIPAQTPPPQGQAGFAQGGPPPARPGHQTIPLGRPPAGARSSRGHTVPLMPGVGGGAPRSAPVFAEPLPPPRAQVPTVIVERRTALWPYVALGVGIVLVVASIAFAVTR
ncbi:MAG: protein kinase [Myxococcales bacterium]|nr:protein kinase [Myxococcales bacterium]